MYTREPQLVCIKKPRRTGPFEWTIFWRQGESVDIHRTNREIWTTFSTPVKVVCLKRVLQHGVNNWPILSTSNMFVIRIVFEKSTVTQGLRAKQRQQIAAMQSKFLGSERSRTANIKRAKMPQSNRKRSLS